MHAAARKANEPSQIDTALDRNIHITHTCCSFSIKKWSSSKAGPAEQQQRIGNCSRWEKQTRTRTSFANCKRSVPLLLPLAMDRRHVGGVSASIRSQLRTVRLENNPKAVAVLTKYTSGVRGVVKVCQHQTYLVEVMRWCGSAGCGMAI